MKLSPLTIRNCVFSFKCDAKWEEMESEFTDYYMESENVRFCQTCQKEVYLSLTDEDLLRNVRLNRCVAITRIDGDLIQTTAGLIE